VAGRNTLMTKTGNINETNSAVISNFEAVISSKILQTHT
jgi:hypothetical protein